MNVTDEPPVPKSHAFKPPWTSSNKTSAKFDSTSDDDEGCDILKIDRDIRQRFSNEKEMCGVYKSRLQQLDDLISNSGNANNKLLQQSRDDLAKQIQRIESDEEQNYYISETADIIRRYTEIISTPVKQSFVGKPSRHALLPEKRNVIEKYLSIAKKYTADLQVGARTDIKKKYLIESPERFVCNACGNKKDYDVVEDDTYICLSCFAQDVVVKYTSSYRDSDRVNITSKYTYDRRIHFRDSINQYQGKQNCVIEESVYASLEAECEKHHLLVGDSTTPRHIRFEKITKDHIMLFLKDLNLAKHYENVNLIYLHLTDRKPEDITHLEDKLMHDFDLLTELYDEMYRDIDRKNFINTQYVLVVLLARHKCKVNKSDFAMLKTLDRKSFHDDVCRELFTHLGWNYESLY
jgi:hypothetical protein